MPEPSRRRGRIIQRSRARLLAGVLVGAVTLAVLPVAIAWACAPSTAQIAFDQPSYNAGAPVKVIGSGFARDNPVTLNLQPPSGAPQTVAPNTTTNATGYFEATFTLPANAAGGTYALQAVTDPSGQGHGGQTQPTTATGTFAVAGAAGAPAAGPPAAGQMTQGAAITQTPASAPSSPTVTTAQQLKAALAKAVAKCNKKYKAKKGMSTAKKKKLAKSRAACVKKAKKANP